MEEKTVSYRGAAHLRQASAQKSLGQLERKVATFGKKLEEIETGSKSKSQKNKYTDLLQDSITVISREENLLKKVRIKDIE